jgi:carbamoyltransferase
VTAILGISAFYHDSAAALVVDGDIVAAAQEERFSRRKHDERFPLQAIRYCLDHAGLRAQDVDYVGFYDKPFLKFDRLIETYLAHAPRGFRSFVRAAPPWLKQKLHLPREMRRALGGAYGKRFVFTEHHESHAASAFFPSPFREAAILTLDGVGEWATASLGRGEGNRIALTHELRFPHSLGLLYSAFTYYCGFAINDGEYKLMGLAPYGEPKYAALILEKLLDLKEDGSFRMDMAYFDYCAGSTMTNERFARLFGGPPRRPEAPIEERHMDVAASIQKVTEEVVLRMARFAHARTGSANLCLAGGVALNCVGNGRILREGPFERIWIQPAAGDAGGALGVALFVWYQLLGNARPVPEGDFQHGSLLGSSYGDEELRAFLDGVGAVYRRFAGDEELCADVAEAVADGKVVGWFQGRMEFGPRALGARSILGDARRAEMQSTINQKVKFREGFRPFAPVVLEEHAHEYFELERGCESPYMLLVVPVRESRRRPEANGQVRGFGRLRVQRSDVPAVTHVDYSARVQTVDAKRHGLFRKLLEAYHARTGCPVMVNTSFNLGWDPIVCTPRDAYQAFMSSELDVLCMGHFVLKKSEQPANVGSAARAREEQRADPVLDGRLHSPCCRAELERRTSGTTIAALACSRCSRAFPVTDGIAQLFWPHEAFDGAADVTEMVKAFYEETPFPNYDDHDSVRSLIDKARLGLYARALDETIPYNASVLEVGCGTGQLSNFLGVSCRRVIGTDMCMNSLRLGESFRRAHDLARVRFLQMNLFRPVLKPGQFDVVLCNGVLHHTADPRGGFLGLVPLVKPGGHIVIGLYNRYGRLFTDLRRQLFRITGGRAQWIDPILRRDGLSTGKRRAWFADQYRHPHESKHTVDEVLGWFDGAGLEFVRGVPSVTPAPDRLVGTNLFQPSPRGSGLEHLVTQAQTIVSGYREGGFFLMIARRPGRA